MNVAEATEAAAATKVATGTMAATTIEMMVVRLVLGAEQMTAVVGVIQVSRILDMLLEELIKMLEEEIEIRKDKQDNSMD